MLGSFVRKFFINFKSNCCKEEEIYGICFLNTTYIFSMKKILFLCFLIILVGCSIVSSKEREVIIIAHRGASGYAPENTIEAFKIAQQLNADFIEFDIHMTKDQVLVANHDVTVERTTNGVGKIQDLTVNELKKLDAGSWFNQTYPQLAKEEYVNGKILTVEEIFQQFGYIEKFVIEIKYPYLYPGIEEKLIKLLKKYNLLEEGKVILLSANQECLKKLNKLAPELKLGLLFLYKNKANITYEEMEDLKKFVSIIVPNYNSLTEEYIRNVKNAGFEIYTYTVNSRETYDKLIYWGIDGIITDYPDIERLKR